MDRQNTKQVMEMSGSYRPVASSCLRTWMARDTNRYIRRKNRQFSGLVCRRASRTLDAEWQNQRSSTPSAHRVQVTHSGPASLAQVAVHHFLARSAIQELIC